MPRPRASSDQGFTLLEILMVLAIVGIVVTFAVLSISGKSEEARMHAAADRLQAVFRLAADEAIMRHVQLGLRIRQHGYRFLSLGQDHEEGHEDQWATYRNAPPLLPHKVKQDIQLRVYVQGLESRIPGKKKGDAPQSVFLSSGEVTPFAVEIHARGQRDYYRIRVDLNGKITSSHEGASA
jgi:general secretion pathway protein H